MSEAADDDDVIYNEGTKSERRAERNVARRGRCGRRGQGARVIQFTENPITADSRKPDLPGDLRKGRRALR